VRRALCVVRGIVGRAAVPAQAEVSATDKADQAGEETPIESQEGCDRLGRQIVSLFCDREQAFRFSSRSYCDPKVSAKKRDSIQCVALNDVKVS
jgi:hypothetical protein